MKPIGVIRGCYKEKFGIPRQPGLVSEARAFIEFYPPYNHPDYFRALEGFSHLWLVFVFHQHKNKQVSALVRPPRLGGNDKVGVFASRSSFRPNPLGLSVVRLESIQQENNLIRLEVSGIDLVDGTPLLDIKPYIEYSDALASTRSGYVEGAPEPELNVDFSAKALRNISNYKFADSLKRLIMQTLAYDPRPAYAEDSQKIYGMKLEQTGVIFDIKWTVADNTAEVIDIIKLT